MGVKLFIVQMMMLVMLLFIQGAIAQNTNRSVALPGCEERCGSLVVPYPFGIGPNCSAYKTMEIYCNNSVNPPKAFSSRLNYNTKYTKDLEVLNISLEAGTIRINNPITTVCTSKDYSASVSLTRPFTFSNTENRFTAMGCDNLALLLKPGSDELIKSMKGKPFLQAIKNAVIGGCVTNCGPSPKKDDNTCFGINCCQTEFPPSLWIVQARSLALCSVYDNSSVRSVYDNSSGCSEGPRYAFVVDRSWFGNLTDIDSVKSMEAVPAVLDWRAIGACQSFDREVPLCGKNTLCTNQRIRCSCKEGYEGNPYLPEGCQDIDECATNNTKRCEHSCNNTPGNYTCSCKDGWLLVDNFKCMKKEVDQSVKKAAIIILIATCAGLGVVLNATWWLYKVIRRRNTR